MSILGGELKGRGGVMLDAIAAGAYIAVVNDEEQYSLWLANKPIPRGWHEGGMTGAKGDVLKFIEQVWTDIRPLSLRKQEERAGLERDRELGGGESGALLVGGPQGRATNSGDGS